VLGVVGVHNWQLALFSEQAQQDVWGEDTSAQISSSYAPMGTVEAVDGGYRFSGRWSFSSGCDHCDWAFLGGIVPGKAPAPDMRTFLLPRSDYEILDTWHVAGLSGTGSKDIVVDGAFVPEHRTHRFIDAFSFQSPGQTVNPSALYRLPFASIFTFGIAVPAIGAAEGAFETYRAQMREKISVYDMGKVADDPFAQVRIAEAAAEIDAARGVLRRVWEPMLALADSGQPIPLELRIRARRGSAEIVTRGIRAVDVLFEASGGRGIFLDNPMQRYFRDVHAMRAHAMNNADKANSLFGRAELRPGEPPRDLFL
jgi:3-hydroxy-9,10-secoandrosta-1,3,5(10)-triene-9,17-dione monooxygenase